MKAPRTTVEGTLSINVNDVKELSNGTYRLNWGNDEAINIDRYKNHVILRYVYKSEVIRIHVDLDTTSVGYGIRTWFNCSDCGTRTAKLYKIGGKFACRKCHNLIYMTSRYSGNRLNMLGLKIRRLQRELGMNTSDIHNSPTYKPKYMHQSRFDIQRTKLEIMQLHFIEEWGRIAGAVNLK